MARTLLLAASLLGLTWYCNAGPLDARDAAAVRVDHTRRAVIVPARVAPRKINDPRYKEIYPIEVIACYPFPRGQKAHETVVTIEARPSAVHKALEDFGLKAGAPAQGEAEVARGPAVRIFLEFPGPDGETKRVPIEKTLIDPKTNKPMPRVTWRFTGSALVQPDPNKADTVYGADQDGTLIAIFPVTNRTVFQTDLTMKEEKYVKLETDKRLLPKEGTAVNLIIEVPEGK